jgi:uridylate kinase
MKSIYKRVIIKLSGEALADTKEGMILDREKLTNVAEVVSNVCATGTQVGIVVGAGNIWRGRLADKIGIESSTADYMGMLGTIMNALAIQSAIEEKGLRCRVMSAINVPQVCEAYIRRKAMSHLDKGIVTIFAGGTGNPYFTTDSCATLRALEVGADAILMAKNGVDGVYDSDPRKNKDAKMYKELSFHDVVEKKLQVMDLTAVAMLEGKGVTIRVFNMDDPSNFMKVVSGEDIGTTIRSEIK